MFRLTSLLASLDGRLLTTARARARRACVRLRWDRMGDGDAPACTRTRTPHPTHRNLGVINRLQCNPPHRKLSGQVERESVPYGTRGSRVASATGGGNCKGAGKKAGAGREWAGGRGTQPLPNWRHIYRLLTGTRAEAVALSVVCSRRRAGPGVRLCCLFGPFAKPYRSTVPYRHDRGAAGGRGVPCSRPRRLPRPRRAVMVDMSCLERPRKGGRLRVCGTLTAVLNRDLELRRQRDTPHPYLSRYRGTHLLSSAPSACL